MGDYTEWVKLGLTALGSLATGAGFVFVLGRRSAEYATVQDLERLRHQVDETLQDYVRRELYEAQHATLVRELKEIKLAITSIQNMLMQRGAER